MGQSLMGLGTTVRTCEPTGFLEGLVGLVGAVLVVVSVRLEAARKGCGGDAPPPLFGSPLLARGTQTLACRRRANGE
jgi:hypothetical protein